MQTEGTESWPVEAASADHDSSNAPPPLVQVARAVPVLTKVEKSVPSAPPPLTKVEKTPVIPPLTEVKKTDANTASQTASSEQSATLVPTSSTEPVAVPQNASEVPSQPAAPPPALVVIRKGETPPPAPALETIRPSDWVYLLMGMNVDNDRVELCRVVPSKEVEVRVGSTQRTPEAQQEAINAHLRDLVIQDLQKAATEKHNDHLKERLGHISIQVLEVSAVDKTRGIIYRAQAVDSGREDDGTEDRFQGNPYPVYHWCIVKYLIVSPKRMDLTQAFFGQL
jgi:hypothetical protein